MALMEKAMPIDWDARVKGWIDNAPLCACGCGKKVAVNVEKAKAARQKNYKYRPYIQGHNFRQISALQLTARERSIIIGTLLGDGWCGFPHAKATMPRLVISHGAKQAEYAEWKAAELQRLNAKVVYSPNPGWGDSWARVVTGCHESLREFHAMFYGEGGKVISSDVAAQIDPLALAVWVGDDGSLESDYRLHTEGFDIRSIENLSVALWKMGVENTILENSRGHSFIRTYRPGTVRLSEMISQHIPDSMRYKIWQK